jgi:hypothetical protein
LEVLGEVSVERVSGGAIFEREVSTEGVEHSATGPMTAEEFKDLATGIAVRVNGGTGHISNQCREVIREMTGDLGKDTRTQRCVTRERLEPS